MHGESQKAFGCFMLIRNFTCHRYSILGREWVHDESKNGAGTRDRTEDASLEGSSFTTKLCPQKEGGNMQFEFLNVNPTLAAFKQVLVISPAGMENYCLPE